MEILMHGLPLVVIASAPSNSDQIAMSHWRVICAGDLVWRILAEILFGVEDDNARLHQWLLQRHHLIEERFDALELSQDLLGAAFGSVGDEFEVITFIDGDLVGTVGGR